MQVLLLLATLKKDIEHQVLRQMQQATDGTQLVGDETSDIFLPSFAALCR